MAGPSPRRSGFGRVGGTSPAMTTLIEKLPLRRVRPRFLRAAQALERLGHCQHAEIVEAAADDLHADREALGVIAAIDRHGGIFGHVPWHRVADVLERP